MKKIIAKYKNNIFFWYFSFFSILSIIFLIVTFWNYSLILGWVSSLVVVFWGWLTKIKLKVKVIKSLQGQQKQKLTTFFLSFVYFTFVNLGYGFFFFLVLLINKQFKHTTNVDIVLQPINFITFVLGSLSFTIILIIWGWKNIDRRWDGFSF